MKKVLIVGGGKWQVPITKRCKELNYTVISTNLYEDSPAFQYADYSYVIDVLDKEKNLEIAKLHNIDAVLTDQSDIAVTTVAYINEKLNLNLINIKVAMLYTNKLEMRKKLKLPDLYHPQYKLCKNIKDVKEFYIQLNSNIILKPLNNQSSRGVEYISNIQDIEKAFKRSIQFSKNNLLLAEEFIGGIELTVEGFKYKDSFHKTFAVSKKTYFKHKIGLANSLTYQPIFKEFDINILKKINNKLFDTLQFGITHVEYKYYNGKFYLIEAAIRGGGTKISSDIVPIVSGYKVDELLIKTALGRSIIYKNINYKNKYAILEFFNFTTGRVKDIIGVNKVKNIDNIVDIELEFKIGDLLENPIDDRGRFGYYIAFADTINELKKIKKTVKETIQIIYEAD